MRILVYDLSQNASGVPAELKTPALADTSTDISFTITIDTNDRFTVDGENLVLSDDENVTTSDGENVILSRVFGITAIGIGNTDATTVTIDGQTIELSDNEKNGLYIVQEITSNSFNFSHNGTYLGRLAIGVSRQLGLSPSNEPGFYSTAQPRITASGQVVEGAGGLAGRTIGVDVRYKIDESFYDDFTLAYSSQISRGFPLFLLFDKESHRMPYERLYGRMDNAEVVFQSSVNRFLYSRRFEFSEAF